MEHQFITTFSSADVAAMAKCSDDTIKRAEKRGEIQGMRVGRLLRFSKQEVERYLNQKRSVSKNSY